MVNALFNLINFFAHHQYFKNLIPEKEQASVLTKFSNETMLKNAKAWQSRSSPPLSAENLLVSWHFFLARNLLNTDPSQDVNEPL